ncbi:MAG: hypothetical protein KJ000_18475 [Pirellulaceae bacterium]|nr:hypothetical protein [Pirellulaceae bacterium]
MDAVTNRPLVVGVEVAGAASAMRGPLGPINGGTEGLGCTVITINRIASDIASPHGNRRFAGTAAWRYRTAGIGSLIESMTRLTGSLGSSRRTARIVATALVGEFGAFTGDFTSWHVLAGIATVRMKQHNREIRQNPKNRNIRQNRYSLPPKVAEISF